MCSKTKVLINGNLTFNDKQNCSVFIFKILLAFEKAVKIKNKIKNIKFIEFKNVNNKAEHY